MRVGWIVPGSLEQPTGGYIYDRLIIEQLRESGDSVDLGATDGVDVVVGDGLAIPTLVPIFERRTSARVLLVHHLTSWEGRDELRSLEARAIHGSDGLIATSPATAARVSREYPGAPPCEVVMPGADRLPLRPRPARDGPTLSLLLVGSLIPRKRIPLVLEALALIPDVQLRLRIIGDPTRDPEHARRISEGIDSRVTLLGVVDDDTLATELARADALILASSLEGYGMVLTEALRAGLPLVVSREALAAIDLEPGVRESFDSAVDLASVIGSLSPSRLASLSQATQSFQSRSWRDAGSAFRAVLTRVIQRAVEERFVAHDR